MAKKFADVISPAAAEDEHNLVKLIKFLEDARSSGTMRYLKCSWSQGGDGGESYSVKIPSRSEMEKMRAIIQDQKGVTTPAQEAAPAEPSPASKEVAAPVVTQSSKKNVVKASRATASHLRGYYPREFLKGMGLA